MLKKFHSTISQHSDGRRSVIFIGEIELEAGKTYKSSDNWDVLNDVQKRVNAITAPLVQDVPAYAMDDCKI